MHVRDFDADAEVDPAQHEQPVQPSDRTLLRSLIYAVEVPLRWLRLTGSNRSSFRRGVVAAGVLGVAAWIGTWQGYGWYQLSAGRRALQVGRSSNALKHFQAVLTIWPDDAEIQLLATRAAWRSHHAEVAEHYLKNCQSAPSLAERAQFERVLLRASKGEVDAVGGVCQAMLQEQHPETPLIFEALALGNLTLLRVNDSAEVLDRWLEVEPDHPQAVLLYGRLQLQTGNNQDALTMLRRAVELDPERSDARLLLAGLYLDLGQAQEALPHLEEVCRREPDSIAAQARMAQALVLLARTKEAATLLDRVLVLQPNLASALLERGKIALIDGDLEQAEEYLQQACNSDPGDRAAHYQLLQCLKQRGKTSEARSVQERMSQIDLDSKRLNRIITAELPQRRFDPDLHAELGELLLNAGAVNDGIRWINHALQLDPRLPRAHRALARHYQSLGQAGLAKQHLALIDPAAEPESPQ